MKNPFNKDLFLMHDQDIQARKRRNRIIGWSIFYALIVVIFAYNIQRKISNVDTKVIPSGQVELAASQLQYTSGTNIHVTLKNGLSSTMTLNDKCPQEPLSVYRWENNVWLRIHTTVDNSVCASQAKQITIPPGGSYDISYANWSQLFATPGIYRVAALANNYNGVAYTDFDIVAPPTAAPSPTVQTVYRTIYTPIYIQVPVASSPTPTQTTAPSTTSTGTSGGTTQNRNDN